MNRYNKKRNNFWKKTINLFLLALFLFYTSQLSLSKADLIAVDWQDDFDDGNLDDWTVSGISWTQDHGWDIWDGDCSVDDNQMQFDEVSLWEEWVTNKQVYNYSCLSHSTTIANGTWSFDIYPGNSPVSISLISQRETVQVDNQTVHNPYETLINGYSVQIIPFSYDIAETEKNFGWQPREGLQITGKPAIGLEKIYSQVNSSLTAIYESDEITSDKWYHIDIIRTAYTPEYATQKASKKTIRIIIDSKLSCDLVTDDIERMETLWAANDQSDFYFQVESFGETRLDNVSVIQSISLDHLVTYFYEKRCGKTTPTLELIFTIPGAIIAIIITRFFKKRE
jgi:hypothetical protein